MEKNQSKPQRDRPVINTMPEPIPDTLENVAWAVLNTLPKAKDDWQYLKKTH